MQPQEPQKDTQNIQPVPNDEPTAQPSEAVPYSETTQQTNSQLAGQVFTPGNSSSPQPAPTPITPPTTTSSIQSPGPLLTESSLTPPTLMSGSSMQQDSSKKKFKPSKKWALISLAPLLLVGGASAAYFGYVVPNKPENVWSKALANTGKGYDKLSEYATAKKDVKSMSADGSFKLSGGLAADGSFKGLSDGENGQLTGNVSAVGLKVNYDVRSIKSSGDTSDIYFKIDGIQGLGTMVGDLFGGASEESAALTKALNGLNGQWYFVDHTLFDQFAKDSNESLKITSADVAGALKAVGDSSKQYLFTENEEKRVVVVKSFVGKEDQDGRKVYHYRVAVNKNNLKEYNKSLCDNLIKTKLFKLFSEGGSGDVDLGKQCYDSTGIDNISESDTADAWVDAHTKLIHKIRIHEKDNSNSYFDIIQDYQGGDEFPFSLGFHTSEKSIDDGIDIQSKSTPETTTGLIKMQLNMKTNKFTMDANVEQSGSSKQTATFKLTLQPTTEKVKVEKPAGAKTIIELMNDLGLGDLVASGQSGVQGRAKDTERRTDLNALASQLEVYYSDNGYYPTLANVNSSSWRKTNLMGSDDEALKDPDGSQAVLVSTPQAKAYAYQPEPANCTADKCTVYTLTAVLDDGSKITKKSLN